MIAAPSVDDRHRIDMYAIVLRVPREGNGVLTAAHALEHCLPKNVNWNNKPLSRPQARAMRDFVSLCARIGQMDLCI